MADFRASLASRLEMASLTPPEINALLFYRLGQFVVWGREHRDLAASDADLWRLLETATEALSRGGVLESDGSIVPDLSRPNGA